MLDEPTEESRVFMMLKLHCANAIMETALHAILSVTDSTAVDLAVVRNICAQALEAAKHAVEGKHD